MHYGINNCIITCFNIQINDLKHCSYPLCLFYMCHNMSTIRIVTVTACTGGHFETRVQASNKSCSQKVYIFIRTLKKYNIVLTN